MMERTGQPVEVVDITSPGWNAQMGRYFIGQTGELHFGNGLSAWGGIANPRYSGVNLYFDIFTITNYIRSRISLAKHYFQGMYIIPPGSSFALFFLPPGKRHVSVKIAFGWWEEEI
jgi:hypothetical protein